MSDPAATLAPFLERPQTAGVFSDFDGTLAAIVDDPAAAKPLPGAVDALAALTARFARVAVVSGRPASFLQTWFEGTEVTLSGVYGLETVGPAGVERVDGVDAWRDAIEDVAARSDRDGPGGMRVERKGLSVTLHYREHPDVEPAVRGWAHAEATRTGLAVHDAKMSVELRPPVERDKGTAVRDLAHGLAAVCFLGDDVGDVDAFSALDELAANGVAIAKVAVRSAELPPELERGADLVVDGPSGAVALLRELRGES